MIKTPLTCYQQQLTDGTIKEDAQQRRAVEQLERIFTELQPSPKKLLRRTKAAQHVKGLYLWGSVGIGKTYLMDLFYECITFKKMRMHFFTFMLDIHKRLHTHQGEKNPLHIIAKEISRHSRVICFDEFFVTNIADAMILGELFKALFSQGITLIATSNTAPDNLYQNGLQRERFLPAIAALKMHTHVIHLTTQHDYRTQQKEPAELYFFPLNDATETQMQDAFDFYNNGHDFDRDPIMINQHSLAVIRKNEGILWCDFRDLCETNRSQNDYIALTKQFKTVMIDGLHPIAAKDRKTILRFVHLIDILYDKKVRVIICAAVPAHEIYKKGPHEFEFQRTLSRLIEMQSKK